MSSSGHIQKSLGQYLRVLPVKGFEKTVEDICRYIENSLDLNAAKETLLSKVQEITGNNYCPLMEYPHHLLLPEMRADEAVKAILLSELEIIELVESGLIQNIDTEFLHDFRVAIRRTRSILKQIKGVFYKRIIDRYNTTFSWLGKLTGPLRDTHVYLLKLEYYQQQLSEETRSHLEPLRAFLLKHEILEHKNLVRELAKKRYSNIKSSWREFLTQPVFKKTLLPNADKNIKQVSDAAIWDAYKKVIASGSKIKNDSADEKLHRMRIKCKKLRYLLEFFGDLYPKKQMSVILESLKKLQGMLGDFQDVSVQTTRLRIFETQMEEEGMLTAETLEAMESLVSCLNNIKEDIRKLYMKNYAVLTGKKIKSKFSKLFNTVSEMP
ncbi:MAG TPA: CHAD domain-containing protein [Gammaproteobacteria bacterium]